MRCSRLPPGPMSRQRNEAVNKPRWLTEVPDTLIVSSTHPPAPTYSLHSPGKFQLGPLPSRLLLAALLTLPASTPVSVERTGSAVVTSSEDILSTVEFHYMRLSMSTKWQCTFCPSRSCAHFPCQLPGEATSPLRQICTVCLGCKSPQPSHLPTRTLEFRIATFLLYICLRPANVAQI